ncbi:MAG: hypothetical protein R3D98_14670 [Candidatus Krumholzibacteriia bacterium]
MRQYIEKLHELNAGIEAALDAGAMEDCRQLVDERGIVLADLHAAFTAADPAGRDAVAADIEALVDLDRILQARSCAVRDQLGRSLTASTHGGGQALAPAASGVFDRRA